MKFHIAGQFSHFDICDEVFKQRTIFIPSTVLGLYDIQTTGTHLS